jgi:hypothetical protein
MTSILRLFAAATAVLLASPLLPAAAQSVSPAQRTEIEAIIKDYLIKNPEVLQEAYGELEKRQAAAEAEKHQSAVKEHATALFNSKRQVVLGNPQGDVTMVEFFDYNCGYCKRALSDMLEMMKSDPKAAGGAEGISRVGRRLGGSRPGRGRRAHAGPDRKEIPRFPPQASRQPRLGGPGRRRSPPPRMPASTWPGWKRTWPAMSRRRRSRRPSSSPMPWG